MKLGWHYIPHGALNPQTARSQWVDWRMGGMLVLDSPDEARELVRLREDDVNAGRAFVFYRNYPDGFPEDIEERGGPERVINDIAEKLQDNRIIIVPVNEFGTDPEHAAILLKMLKEGTRLNWQIGIGAWGTGMDDARLLQPHMLKVYEYMQGTPHWEICHEYWPNHTPQYHGEKEEWGEVREVHYDPLHYLGGDPAAMTSYANWHIARVFRREYLLQTRHSMSLQRVAVLEHGPDDQDSRYKGWRQGRYDPANEKGVSEDTFADQLVWCQDNVYAPIDPANPYYPYRDLVKVVTPFTYGNAGMGQFNDGDWYGFNVDADVGCEPAFRLFARLEQFAKRKQETEHMPDTERMTVTVKKQVKRRREPAGQEVPGLLQPGEYTMDVSEAYEAQLAGVWYVWRFLADPASNTGYYSATGTPDDPDLWISVAPLPVDPPAPQDPPEEPPVEPPQPPADDHAAILAAIAALNDRLDALEAKIANHYRAGYGWMLEGAETFGGVSTLDVIGE